MYGYIILSTIKRQEEIVLWCKKCGESFSETGGNCDVCGAWNSPNPSEGQNPQSSSGTFIPDCDGNQQIKEIRVLVSSVPFIIGSVLLTIGAVGNALTNVTWLSVLDLAFAAVHITGLWFLVFEAVRRPSSCTKTLTALTMFKVAAVLFMVLVCILFGAAGIVLLLAIMRGAALLFILAVFGGIGFLLIKFYCFYLPPLYYASVYIWKLPCLFHPLPFYICTM